LTIENGRFTRFNLPGFDPEPKIGISPAKDWDDGKQHQGLDDGTVFAGEKVGFFMPICLVWDINT
jgi:hypothetical protein